MFDFSINRHDANLQVAFIVNYHQPPDRCTESVCLDYVLHQTNSELALTRKTGHLNSLKLRSLPLAIVHHAMLFRTRAAFWRHALFGGAIPVCGF